MYISIFTKISSSISKNGIILENHKSFISILFIQMRKCSDIMVKLLTVDRVLGGVWANVIWRGTRSLLPADV